MGMRTKSTFLASRGFLVRTICSVVVLTLCSALVPASEPRALQTAEAKSGENWIAGIADLRTPLAGFDWEAEADRIRVAAEILWERNGWTDEADRFARDLACEVTAIPPWDVMGRFNLWTTRVAERYGLSPEAANRFRLSLVREAGGMFMRNGPVIMENSREAIEARVRGEPFSSEQIAKWAKAAEPLLAELQPIVDRLAKEIESTIDAEHKEVLEKDLESYARRMRYVDTMRAQWSEGRWEPTDWGLEKDPIQNRGVQPSPTEAPAALPVETPLVSDIAAMPAVAEKPAPLPKWLAHDPATWFAYVVEFQVRFQLDPGQKTTAESIHAELVRRAGDYGTRNRELTAAVPAQERATHAAYEPVRAMFAELQMRLDALPTTAQRVTHKP